MRKQILAAYRVHHCFCFLVTLFLAVAFGALTASADTLLKPEGNCARSYIYRSRTYPVDSSRKLDGEGLRPVLRKNADSETLLNSYQTGLKTTRVPAYFGTLGLVALIGGPIYAAALDENHPVGKHDIRRVALLGGVGVLVGSYFFGKYVIHNNEKNLEKAVQTYNDSASGMEKIQVGFTPLSTGDGGQIKTIVPFQF
ncbi:MAG: hypothetical protein HYW49_09555 [Deltaproteobacteria bacterium]|nr:hypothetical protein [Deltaproteobacteria bacterium]